MHEWRERAINQFNYGGDLLHIDFLTIPGASVKHLRHAWNVEYRKPSSKIPVDVLLLAGTNDLMQSSNATNVQSVLSDDMWKLRFDIVHANHMSSFAICTPPLAPKLIHLPEDPPRFRPLNSDVTFDNVTTFVRRIREMNQLHSNNQVVDVFRAPLFHTHGLDSRRGEHDFAPRTIDPDRPLQFSAKHRLSLWREPCFSRVVHLNDYQTMKMGMSIIKHFKHIWDQ